MTAAQLTWLLGELIAQEARSLVPRLRLDKIGGKAIDQLDVALKQKRGQVEHFRITVEPVVARPMTPTEFDGLLKPNGEPE